MADTDLDQLLVPLLTYAKKVLSLQKGFLPFGAAMDRAGQIAMAPVEVGETPPTPMAVVDQLIDGFRQAAAAGRVRAIGVCVNIRVVPPGGVRKVATICAQLEHEDGECADVYLPYRRGWIRRFAFGKTFAAHRGPRVFLPAAPTAPRV